MKQQSTIDINKPKPRKIVVGQRLYRRTRIRNGWKAVPVERATRKYVYVTHSIPKPGRQMRLDRQALETDGQCDGYHTVDAVEALTS